MGVGVEAGAPLGVAHMAQVCDLAVLRRVQLEQVHSPTVAILR